MLLPCEKKHEKNIIMIYLSVLAVSPTMTQAMSDLGIQANPILAK